ncbi:phage holin family protein [Turicimonas muris]|uniref:phage holin family protein n=1 Tax=Turicimonas muris TaxID=1796652 RepID=UPI0023F12753|nr:phage holin family protein [Turicimonas muris]
MPEKDPQFLSFFHTTLALAMFLFGGVLRCTQKIIEGKEFKFGEFIFELISSLFVGMIFYLLARGLGAAEFVAVGISATMSYFGTKALSIVYKQLEKKDV